MDERGELDVAAALRLPALPGSARQAREFIADFCQAARVPADTYRTAELLVSELVTNAVLHGRTSATVEVHHPGEALRVAVRDDNPALPPVGETPALSAESGRGLLIVDRLASRWGIEAGVGGKAVWFELDLQPAGLKTGTA